MWDGIRDDKKKFNDEITARDKIIVIKKKEIDTLKQRIQNTHEQAANMKTDMEYMEQEHHTMKEKLEAEKDKVSNLYTEVNTCQK